MGMYLFIETIHTFIFHTWHRVSTQGKNFKNEYFSSAQSKKKQKKNPPYLIRFYLHLYVIKLNLANVILPVTYLIIFIFCLKFPFDNSLRLQATPSKVFWVMVVLEPEFQHFIATL